MIISYMVNVWGSEDVQSSSNRPHNVQGVRIEVLVLLDV